MEESSRMRTYIIRKLLWFPIMLLAISFLSFLAVGLVTESNVNQIVIYVNGEEGPDSANTKDVIKHQLGIEQPFWLHYLRWMGIVRQENGNFRGILQGSLGEPLYPIKDGRGPRA
jgi:ABC-type dipeptide/oligopeptide/nickel transport system permease component